MPATWYSGPGEALRQPPAQALPPVATDLPALVAQVEPSVVTLLVGDGPGSGVVIRDGDRAIGG